MSQLAMAHERQLIKKGSVIKIIANNAPDLTKPSDGDKSREEATIKLQVLKEGTWRDEYVDLNLNNENPFTMGFK